jgi:hypothetical protein
MADTIDEMFKKGLAFYNEHKLGKAIRLFRKAAKQGHAEAQLYMGNCYQFGQGVFAFDHEKAIEWYLKSAKQGNAAAYYYLGTCYEWGDYGAPKNENEALKCYQKGMELGSKAAKEYYEKLKEKMFVADDEKERSKQEEEAAETLNQTQNTEPIEIDIVGGLKKAAKAGLKIAATIAVAAAEAEANAPVRPWQCQYCGQVIYSKHKPGVAPCPAYRKAGSNASRITPHVWRSM